jgi:methionyl-tRNA formyltransferase
MTGQERPRVVLIGAVHEARAALNALAADERIELAAVVTRTPLGAARLAGAADLVTPAASAGVVTILSDDANDPRVVGAVRALEPALLVVVGWTQLIGEELLRVPSAGCVGFHASMLPEHRGHAPVNWAIIRGEASTGNTMLMLDPGVDTGDIVAQRRIIIGREDTCATVYDRVAEAGADMLREFLPDLIAGTAPRRPQDRRVGDVLPRRTPEMGVIDWNRPAEEVYNWIRALTLPYPGAFTHHDDQRVMVWAAQPPGPGDPRGEPGQLLAYERDGVRVGTADGSILLTRLSSPGHRPEHARRWLRRSRLALGQRFELIAPEVSRWARGERNNHDSNPGHALAGAPR